MKKKYFVCRFLKLLICCIIIFNIVGCEKDDAVSFDEGTLETDKVSSPSFDKFLTTSTYDQFTIKIRFKNGGDIYENMKCTVYWRAYSVKPSKEPKAKDLTKVESMRIIDHGKTKTVFDKTHVGFKGGTYIYYYAVCKNGRGSCKTSIDFTVIKRL